MRISDWSSDVCSSDLDRLADIARKGYAAIKSTVVPGITDISVPVMSNGAAVASLALPYMKSSGVPLSQQEATAMARGVAAALRQEARRVGKGSVSMGRARGAPVK